MKEGGQPLPRGRNKGRGSRGRDGPKGRREQGQRMKGRTKEGETRQGRGRGYIKIKGDMLKLC